MRPKPTIAQLLEPFALEDIAFGYAYEAVPASFRALCKNSIAKMHAAFGELSSSQMQRQLGESPTCFTHTQQPAPFVFVLCPTQYAYASAFLGACMAAVLGRVPRIIPCFVSTPPNDFHAESMLSQNQPPEQENGLAFCCSCTQQLPVSSYLLSALDIAGISEAYTASIAEAHMLFSACVAEWGVGRLVVMGNVDASVLVLEAHAAGVACATLARVPAYSSHSAANVVALSEASCLHMGAKNAAHGMWVWPELLPSWYMNNALDFS